MRRMWGQGQVAFPILEDIQKCPYRTKGGHHNGSRGFFCLWFHWPVQMFNLLLGWLPAPSASAFYRRLPPWKE